MALALKATSLDECDLISALLQDSIYHLSHSDFHEEARCFYIMLNRFCWELCTEKAGGSDVNFSDGNECYYRALCGLYIHNVESVHINGNFSVKEDHPYCNLLSMHASENEMNLLFSGNKHICLHVSGICVFLKDLHEEHPTLHRPNHATLEEESV